MADGPPTGPAGLFSGFITSSLANPSYLDINAVLIALAAVFLTIAVIRSIYVSRPSQALKTRSPHKWVQGAPTRTLPAYCVDCEGLITFGNCQSCLICGRCAHQDHVRKADSLPCKSIWDLGGVFVDGKTYAPPHQLVKGNLTLDAVCAVCNQRAGTEPGLSDYRCLWCQLCVHSDCRGHFSPVCSLGPVADAVLDPRAVTVSGRSKTASLGSTKFRLSLDTPKFAQTAPILCFVNPRSGEQATSVIFSSLYRSLNPLQIVDLTEHKPEVLLKVFLPYLDRCRILVCGGDGTIAWILNAIDSLKLEKPPPPLGLIPLGTGNDLARVLGWGGGYRGEDVVGILRDVRDAQPLVMDRWKVTTIEPGSSRFSRAKKTTSYMINYWSFGVDAHITLGFHTTRESNPELFRNRLVNKFIYVGVLFCLGYLGNVTNDRADLFFSVLQFLTGTKYTAHWAWTKLTSGRSTPDLQPTQATAPSAPGAHDRSMTAESTISTDNERERDRERNGDGDRPRSSSPSPPPIMNLADCSKLWIDGQEISTDGLASIVAVNIPSFGGGSSMALPPVEMDDGKLDLIALSNSVHLASSLVGLTRPIYLGKASEVKAQFKEETPVQVDGEPFVAPRSTVTLSFHKHATMLRRMNHDQDFEDEEEEVDDGYSTEDTASTAEIRSIVGSPLSGLTGLRQRF